MAQVVIYTTDYCPYCTGAKSLLRSKNVEPLARVLRPLLGKIPRQKTIRVTVDVDALNLL